MATSSSNFRFDRAILVLVLAVILGLSREHVAMTTLSILKCTGRYLSTGTCATAPPNTTFQHVDSDVKLTAESFSLEELQRFDGTYSLKNPSSKIYLSIGGIVFDVTSGEKFYGPNGHYHCFAGKAVSRALSLGSLEETDINMGDHVEDFEPDMVQALRDQVDFYQTK
jgi:predicted heme/steroid binding protein